jgi:hypothetical protein
MQSHATVDSGETGETGSDYLEPWNPLFLTNRARPNPNLNTCDENVGRHEAPTPRCSLTLSSNFAVLKVDVAPVTLTECHNLRRAIVRNPYVRLLLPLRR